MHVQVGGFDPRDPLLDPVWGMLADAGMPVVCHCGGPARRRVHRARADGAVLARHPALTAVIAHLGMPEYDAFLDLAERYQRVHLDTTMAFTDFFEAPLAPFPAAGAAAGRDCRTAWCSAATSRTSRTRTPTS